MRPPVRIARGHGSRKRSCRLKWEEDRLLRSPVFRSREALDFLTHLELSPRSQKISQGILKEIGDRLRFMMEVGLDYLTLDRTAASLSGGESQRIRLATQIGSSLVGVLYILDEPSIGLHPRDHLRLLETLKRLRDLGNTVIVVEHDEETIRSADYCHRYGARTGGKGRRGRLRRSSQRH